MPSGPPLLPGDDDVEGARRRTAAYARERASKKSTSVEFRFDEGFTPDQLGEVLSNPDSAQHLMPWVRASTGEQGRLTPEILADLASHPADGTTMVDEPYNLSELFPSRVVRHMRNFRPGKLEAPVQALDIHLDYWRWCASVSHERSSAAFLAAYYGTEANTMPPDVSQIFANQESRDLYDAVTHYVDPDVADVVRQMGEAMPPDKLFATDIPVPNGFVVLGQCWDYMDFHQEELLGRLPIRAISWRTADIAQPMRGDQEESEVELFKPGVYVMLYVDSEWLVWDQDDYPAGQKGLEHKPPIWLMDMWGWTFDTWWEDVAPGEDTDQHHAAEHVGEMRRQLLALWRFMADEIVYTGRTRMPRPALRRWGRTKKEVPADGSIVTVHLRRIKPRETELEKDKTGEASKIEWSHRWWVRGHSRYNHKTQQKDIWVRPYLKGPDDKPIVIKEKLISVDR